MKATGIVRRIDDLGRVVIPKEIRRTMRIREGDPLEIYTDNDGEVIFKKYSPIGELGEFATEYAEVLAKGTELGVIICDRDHCIAAAGLPKKEVLERRVSADLEDVMESRKPYIFEGSRAFNPLEGFESKVSVAVPILASGDISGAVVFTSDSAVAPLDSDQKLALVSAAFLGKQMEDF